MPKHDFERIAQLEETCLKSGIVVKKSELLRAGLAALAALPETTLLAVVASEETVKTGRPANGSTQTGAIRRLRVSSSACRFWVEAL
jgi:hypothetical protein